MRFKLLLIPVFILCILPLVMKAQQVNTLYFMEDVPVRHFLNPSFQPTCNLYISLPIIGLTQFDAGNNSVSVKDVFYNVNGQTVSFLSSQGNIPRFYNTLKSNTLIQSDLQTNLISFGFRHEMAYWTFSLTERIDGSVNLPKDLFKVSLFGTQDSLNNNSFNLTKLEGNISKYTEVALGYSTGINDKLTIGGKLKLLLGTVNFSNTNKRLSLNANVNNWTLKGEGTARYSGSENINSLNNNYQPLFAEIPGNITDCLTPSGIGAGIDLGFQYHLNDNLTLSGAINDLGFIHWSKNAQNYQYAVDYTFNGIKQLNSNGSFTTYQNVYNKLISGNSITDSIITAFRNSTTSKTKSNSYTTFTTAKLNIGLEYSMLNDELSLGLLSYSQLFENNITEEITGSVNARPFYWLNASLSYSVFNSGMNNTIGVGLGIKTGMLHWFVAADCIPTERTSFLLSDLGANIPKISIPIPYNSKYFNLSIGLNIVFGEEEKEDRILHHSRKTPICNCNWN